MAGGWLEVGVQFVGMEYCGWIGPKGYDRLVLRGDVDRRSFCAFWLADDRVVAGMHINRWDDGLAPVEQRIRGREPVHPELLGDSSIPVATHIVSRWSAANSA